MSATIYTTRSIHGHMSRKKVINSPEAPAAVGPYSHAVLAGNLLYVSGQLPIDPSTGEFVHDCIKAQTEMVLNNLGAVLATAGLGMEDVVKTTVYLKDMFHFDDMNEVYAKFFTQDPPARAAFQVARLPKDALVEIEAVALAK